MSDLAGLNTHISATLESARGRLDQTRIDSLSRTSEAGMDQAVAELESVFIGQMMQYMFTDVGKDNPFGGGMAEDIYRSLMVDEFGKLIGRTGGLNLTDGLKGALIGLQERGTGIPGE